MQLCMDSFAEGSAEFRIQNFDQHLRRILYVEFDKISAEVCLQDFSRSLCIIMTQKFNQNFKEAQHAGTPQHYLQNSACINSNAIFVGPSIEESRGNLCRTTSENSAESTLRTLYAKMKPKTPQSSACIAPAGITAELCL